MGSGTVGVYSGLERLTQIVRAGANCHLAVTQIVTQIAHCESDLAKLLIRIDRASWHTCCYIYSEGRLFTSELNKERLGMFATVTVPSLSHAHTRARAIARNHGIRWAASFLCALGVDVSTARRVLL